MKANVQTKRIAINEADELSVLSMHLASLSKELNTIEKDAGDKNLSRSELAERINKSLKILKTQENAWGMFKVYFRGSEPGIFRQTLQGLSRTDQCRSQDVCVHPRRDDHKGDCDCNKQVGKDCGLHKI